MKIVEKGQATGTLAAYTEEVGNGPVVVTDQGKPVAVLVPIDNAGSGNGGPKHQSAFHGVDRTLACPGAAEGGIPSEEMRRRFS